MLCDVTESHPPYAPRAVGQALEKGGVIRPFVMDADIQSTLQEYLTAEAAVHRVREHASRSVLSSRVRCARQQAYVFPRCHTEPAVPMTANQIHHWFRTLCARAGVSGPHATVHHFRHYLFVSPGTRGNGGEPGAPIFGVARYDNMGTGKRVWWNEPSILHRPWNEGGLDMSRSPSGGHTQRWFSCLGMELPGSPGFPGASGDTGW